MEQLRPQLMARAQLQAPLAPPPPAPAAAAPLGSSQQRTATPAAARGPIRPRRLQGRPLAPQQTPRSQSPLVLPAPPLLLALPPTQPPLLLSGRLLPALLLPALPPPLPAVLPAVLPLLPPPALPLTMLTPLDALPRAHGPMRRRYRHV